MACISRVDTAVEMRCRNCLKNGIFLNIAERNICTTSYYIKGTIHAKRENTNIANFAGLDSAGYLMIYTADIMSLRAKAGFAQTV